MARRAPKRSKKVVRHDGAPRFSACWSFDEAHVAVSSATSTAVFDVHEGAQRHVFREPGFDPQALAFAPDSTRLAACGYDLSQPRAINALRVWELTSGSRTTTGFVGGNNTNECLRFAAGGDAVAIASSSYAAGHEHTSLFVWRDGDRPAFEDVRPGTVATRDRVVALGWLGDGRLLLATNAELRALDLAKRASVILCALPDPEAAKVFSDVEGDAIAFGTRAPGVLGRVRLSTGACEIVAGPGVDQLVLAPDGGTVFATSDQDGQGWYVTCQLDTGTLERVIFPEEVRPFQRWLSPRGRRVLFANLAGTLRLWDVTTGTVVGLWRKL